MFAARVRTAGPAWLTWTYPLVLDCDDPTHPRQVIDHNLR
jgi:hypothetical protein